MSERAPWNELDDAVFAAVGLHLATAPEIYRAMEGFPKEEVDASLGKLQELGLVILHEHTSPSDPGRSRLIQWNGKVYVGALRRKTVYS